MKLDKKSEFRKRFKSVLINWLISLVTLVAAIVLFYLFNKFYLKNDAVNDVFKSLFEWANTIGWFNFLIVLVAVLFILYVLNLELRYKRKKEGNLSLDQLQKQEKINESLSNLDK
jgi:NADH:ubiquinone oxidoreductase subunit 5 (subunit L)/multisubunit Na+/H+ antiporter MnhA subunit